MRVLLIGPNASERMGGEAILPLHWLRELRARGVDAELLTHARCRDELSTSAYSDFPITYVEDSFLERLVHRLTGKGSTIVRTSGLQLINLVTNFRLGRMARRMHLREPFHLVHQVTPVSPKALIFSHVSGIPLVVGPMNGNMQYPAAFEGTHGAGTGRMKRLLTRFSDTAHSLFADKRNAECLLVSNQRTAEGLPAAVNEKAVRLLVENGVDLSSWQPAAPVSPELPVFVFVGRLVHWKAVDILLKSFAALAGNARLLVIGSGAEEAALRQLASDLGINQAVTFTGQMTQMELRKEICEATALVLPSVWECGGAVVLEAMACGKAVIATQWGGPVDYITEQTGMMVPPDSEESLISGLTASMKYLAENPDRGVDMGKKGRERVEQYFSWHAKIEEALEIYTSLTDDAARKQT